MPMPDLPEPIAAFNKTLITLARDYDHVTYGLGCKGSIVDGKLVFQTGKSSTGTQCNGTMVDCSGWLALAFTLALRPINPALANRVGKAMATHSDGQITGIAKLGSNVWSGTDIEELEMRPGMLVGANFGEQKWEGKDRTYGIDHILCYVVNGDGTPALLQSSGGLGVNMVTWDSWLKKYKHLIKGSRAHVVDVFDIVGMRPGTLDHLKTGDEPIGDDALEELFLNAESG